MFLPVHSIRWNRTVVTSSLLTGGFKLLDRLVSAELLPVASDPFRCVYVDKYVLVETFKSGDNRQHLLHYSSIPGFQICENTTYVLSRLIVVKYRCAKAILAWVTAWWGPVKVHSNTQHALLLLAAAHLRMLVPRASSMEYPSESGDELVLWVHSALKELS